MRRLTTMLSTRAAAFRTSRRGSIPILFALSLLPLVGLIGLGIDYGVAASNKTKLDTAADAAAIAAVVTAKTYLADNAGQADATTKAIAAGIAKATNAFRANVGTVALAQIDLPTPQLSRNGQTLTAVVSYSAAVRNTFGPLFGSPTTTLTNTATATTDIASYLDFYLLLDVSGSMGLPTSEEGMARLAAVNKDNYDDYKQGCQFACHFPGQTGWGLAVRQIQLRSDAVNKAVCSLIKRASNPAVPNQYRVGLYPFVSRMGTLAKITSNVANLNTTAQCGSDWPNGQLALTNLLDTGSTQLATLNDPSTGTGSGGTHFENVLPQIKSEITSFGDGSSMNKSKPFVFLITDGMQNYQYYSTFQNNKQNYPGYPSLFPGFFDAWWSDNGSEPMPIDPSNCDAVKRAGATMSVLYIPYNIIRFVDRGGDTAWENNRVNGFSPTLATPLKSCASPGFFFSANTSDDITASLNAMFDKALQVARITK